MNWFKKLLMTAIWISIAQTSQAQQHYNVWFRSTLSGIDLPKSHKLGECPKDRYSSVH